jgi:drug/metabolite transporter (DMT)-like permease
VALFAFGVTGFYEQVSWQAIWAAKADILFVGVLSSALTFTLLAAAMRSTQPAKVAVLLSTESLFSALAAYLILGERLPPVAWLGAVAIFAATLVVHVPSGKA